MRKGLWSPDEDEKLKNCIALHRRGSWSDLARKAGLQRCGKSCRRRWMNHLRPDLNQQKFTPEEIKLVAKLHQTLGNKWSEIATYLVGRTDNDVKNLWNTQLKKQSRSINNEAPFRSKGNKLEGFPFCMDSNFDHMEQLSFEKSQLPKITISSTPTSFIASSWGPFPSNASKLNLHPKSQNILEENHDMVDSSYKPIIMGTSYESEFAQIPLIYQHAKPEGGLDECNQVENRGSCAISMGCKIQNHLNGCTHCIYYKGDHTQIPALDQHAKLPKKLECSLDEFPMIDNNYRCMVPMGCTTPNHPNDDLHYSNFFPTSLSSLLMESIGKDQQGNSQFFSSYTSSWEGVGSSNETSTSTQIIGDDTCSVSQPSPFELHYNSHFQKSDNNNSHSQDQKDDDDAICLSRGESWSSSSEEWAFETLIGMCEKDAWC